MLEPGERSRRHGKSRESFALRPAAFGNISRGEQSVRGRRFYLNHRFIEPTARRLLPERRPPLVMDEDMPLLISFFFSLSSARQIDWGSDGGSDGANELGRLAAHLGS